MKDDVLRGAAENVLARTGLYDVENILRREQGAKTLAKHYPDERSPRLLAEWHHDDGPVLWWKFPVHEPPYVGDPTCDSWPGYHTHWTPIPMPKEPKENS